MPVALPPDPRGEFAWLEDDANRERVQQIADQLAVRRSLRSAGIGSLVFGFLALVMGGGGIHQRWSNWILMVLGGLPMAEGLWLILMPRPKGFLVDALALFVLGLWNIPMGIVNAVVSDQPMHAWATALGIWQCIWGS